MVGTQDARIVRAITHDVRFPTSRTRRRLGRDEPRPRLLGGLRRPRDRRARGLDRPRADVHDRARHRGLRRARSRRSRRTSSARRSTSSTGDLRRDVAAPRHRQPAALARARRRASSTSPRRALVNAVWDLYAKLEGKPLWKLLADLTPEQLVACDRLPLHRGRAHARRGARAPARRRARRSAERERCAPRGRLPRLHDVGGLARLSGGDAARSARARRSPPASRT